MKLQDQIKKLNARNARVEADKAWEMSATRKVIIAVLTYFVVVIFFYSAGLPEPWVNSIVPAMGFLLSTLSLPLFKRMWLKYCHK
jgi:hypothetical protein